MSDSMKELLNYVDISFKQFAAVKHEFGSCHLPPDHAYWDELRAWIPEDHVIDKQDVRALDNVRQTYQSCVADLVAGYWVSNWTETLEELTVEGVRQFLVQLENNPYWDKELNTNYDDLLCGSCSQQIPFSDDELAIKRSFVERFSGPPPSPPPNVIRYVRPTPFQITEYMKDGVMPPPRTLEYEDIEIKDE